MRCSAPPVRARADLAAAVETGLASGAVDDVFAAAGGAGAAGRRTGCLGRGRTARTAGASARRGNAPRPLCGERDRACRSGTRRAARRKAVRRPRGTDARAPAAAPARPRPSPGSPSRSASSSPALISRLGEAAAARAVFTESERVLERRPDLGSLTGRPGELRERVAATSGPAGFCGDEPDRSRAPAAPLSRHPSHATPRSASGCSSPGTRSRPRRPRSSASSLLPHAARRSSAPSRSGSWKASSTHRGRSSPEGLRQRGAPGLHALSPVSARPPGPAALLGPKEQASIGPRGQASEEATRRLAAHGRHGRARQAGPESSRNVRLSCRIRHRG